MPINTQQLTEVAEQTRLIYENAETRIVEAISRRAARGLNQSSWQAQKLAELRDVQEDVQGILADLRSERGTLASAAVSGAYANSAEQCRKDIEAVEGASRYMRSGPSAVKPAQILGELNRSVDALDRQILRRAQDAYATVIGTASATLATGAIDLRQAVNDALEDFAKRGIAGFVDAAGRCWEMSTYAEMATLTAIERATRYGYVDTMQEYGHDLAIISSHAGACPLCVDWENVVVSVSGTNPDYPSLDDAEASGCFHPRCLHDISTYYGDLDGRKDIARSEPGHSETPSAAYTARSKQRAYERQIRAWKRVESACKAAGNPQRERAAYNHVRMFQAKIRDLRSAYNANTPRSTDWLPRKYDREGGRLTLSKAALKANTK